VRNGSYDAIVVGAGIIGLSLAIELRKSLRKILVVDRGPIGGESSSAAAGMLNLDPHAPPALASLARHSAEIYPEYIDEIRTRAEAGIEFQRTGAIVLGGGENGEPLTAERLRELEPQLLSRGLQASFVQEDFVAPRSLMRALAEHAHAAEIAIQSEQPVTQIMQAAGRSSGVRCANAGEFSAPVVANCAGAWASQIKGAPSIPTRPVKGQMLALDPQGSVLRHVVRCSRPEVYMLPRLSGTIAVGATVEESSFDRATTPVALHGLREAAIAVLPPLAQARIHESWAGLRPGSPDGLPILGETSWPGYFAATGHFRHGILLAPATARAMAELIVSGHTRLDLSPFSPQRFSALRN
jgi:glycine oxidase